MRIYKVSFHPKWIKGSGIVFCCNLLPVIEIAAFANPHLRLGWLFWEIEFDFSKD